MMEIFLTQGQIALVDDEDFERINQYKWCAQKGRYTYYAKRTSKGIRMHHVILNSDEEIDHIDGNGLNNQKYNLRKADGKNVVNRQKFKNSTSKYKGVFWNKKLDKWQTQIRVNKKAIYLGLFEDDIEAAKAYDKAAVAYFSEFAKLNFC